MNKKILISVFSLIILVLPGFAAAESLAARFLALHSVNVITPEPAVEDEKDCAEHLADLMDEGLRFVATTTTTSALVVSRMKADTSWVHHLASTSSRRPKTAIITCTKLNVEEQ